MEKKARFTVKDGHVFITDGDMPKWRGITVKTGIYKSGDPEIDPQLPSWQFDNGRIIFQLPKLFIKTTTVEEESNMIAEYDKETNIVRLTLTKDLSEGDEVILYRPVNFLSLIKEVNDAYKKENLEIRPTKNDRGYGVFATKRITKTKLFTETRGIELLPNKAERIRRQEEVKQSYRGRLVYLYKDEVDKEFYYRGVFQPPRTSILGWMNVTDAKDDAHVHLNENVDNELMVRKYGTPIKEGAEILLYKRSDQGTTEFDDSKKAEIAFLSIEFADVTADTGMNLKNLLAHIKSLLENHPPFQLPQFKDELQRNGYEDTIQWYEFAGVVQEYVKTPSRDLKDYVELIELTKAHITFDGTPFRMEDIRNQLLAPFEVRDIFNMELVIALQNITVSDRLEIKQSTIKSPEAGNGLFVKTDRKKGDILTEYGGIQSNLDPSEAHADGDSDQTEYAIELVQTTGWFQDAERFFTLSQLGRWPNSKNPDDVNAQFLITDNGKLVIELTKNVKKGDEIFVYYGENFPLPSSQSQSQSQSQEEEDDPDEWLAQLLSTQAVKVYKGHPSVPDITSNNSIGRMVQFLSPKSLSVVEFETTYLNPFMETLQSLTHFKQYLYENASTVNDLFVVARKYRVQLIKEAESAGMKEFQTWLNRADFTLTNNILTAARDFEEGSTVTEYGGVIYVRNIFPESANIINPFLNNKEWILDGSRGYLLTAMGKWALKSSFESNVKFHVVEEDFFVDEMRRTKYTVYLVATKKIGQGELIVIDKSTCSVCQKITDNICGACREVAYCSKDCMRKAGHKFTCKKWKKKQ